MTEIRYFDGDQVRAAVTMPEAIAAVREAFVALAEGDFELLLRTSMRDGGFLTMNVHHSSSATAVVKSISLDFTRRPAVAGAVSFLSQGDGPSAVMDAATITTIRTGAVVGVATDLLAPQDASRLTLIGLGGQAPDQLRAVRAVRPIQQLRLAGLTLAEAESFRDQMAPELGDLDVKCFDDVDRAVSDTDIVCCATTATAPLFAESSLPARVHVNAIGAFRLSMRELPDELLGMATVVVDQREAALEEAGDVVHAIHAGLLHADSLLELGMVLPDGVPSADRTVFKSVGLAIQDWAVARLVAEKTQEWS